MLHCSGGFDVFGKACVVIRFFLDHFVWKFAKVMDMAGFGFSDVDLVELFFSADLLFKSGPVGGLLGFDLLSSGGGSP